MNPPTLLIVLTFIEEEYGADVIAHQLYGREGMWVHPQSSERGSWSFMFLYQDELGLDRLSLQTPHPLNIISP